MNGDELTPQELFEYQSLSGLGSPEPYEKKDIFSFFNKIVGTSDTIKTGNLDEPELASVRILRDSAVFANVMGHELIRQYIIEKAEVILASSLSKKGFLIEMAVTSKKEATLGKKSQRRENKGWYQKKEEA